MRRRVLISAALLLGTGALLLAGCGSEGVVAPAPKTVEGTVPAEPTAGGDVAAGKTLFSKSGCAVCHTLQAAGATGTIGPNLDQKKPALELIVDRVTNGKLPAMPSFSDRLSKQEIADVAAFVFQSTQG